MAISIKTYIFGNKFLVFLHQKMKPRCKGISKIFSNICDVSQGLKNSNYFQKKALYN